MDGRCDFAAPVLTEQLLSSYQQCFVFRWTDAFYSAGSHLTLDPSCCHLCQINYRTRSDPVRGQSCPLLQTETLSELSFWWLERTTRTFMHCLSSSVTSKPFPKMLGPYSKDEQPHGASTEKDIPLLADKPSVIRIMCDIIRPQAYGYVFVYYSQHI